MSKKRFFWRALLSLALIFTLTASPVVAANIYWTGGSSDWNTGTNWVGSTVPGSGDDAYIDNGTVGAAPVVGTGVTAESHELYVGLANTVTSSLTIEGGGTVTTAAATFIGNQAGSRGVITVDGSGSILNVGSALSAGDAFHVGYNGTGELSVTNGGKVDTSASIHIGNQTGSRGVITVDDTGGFGSALSAAGNIFVGEYGTGEMKLINGGTVGAAVNIYLGTSSGSSGTVTVNGSGSALNAGNDLHVGYYSTGELNLTNGGTAATPYYFTRDGSSGGIAVDLTGSLSLVNVNGYTVLTGSATHTGGTTISGGTLQIGDGGTSGSISGNITNNAALVFNRSDALTYGGVISGSGSLTKLGAGNLTLTNANTYTGPTVVEEGRLYLTGIGTLGNGGSGGLTLHNFTVFDISGISSPSMTIPSLDVYRVADIDATGKTVDFTNGVLNFFVPASDAALISTTVTPLLIVSGTADIAGATVNVGITGNGPALQSGAQLILIDATTLLSGVPANTTANGTGMAGIITKYEFDITAVGNQLLATVTRASTNEQLKALSEGRLASLAFAGQGSDLILGPAMYAAMMETQRHKAGLVPFAVLGGGDVRYDTGSHVDVDGVHFLMGLAWRAPIAGKSSLVAGLFRGGLGRVRFPQQFY